MRMPGTGEGTGDGAVGGGGMRTWSHAPARTRSDLAGVTPSSSTSPAAISSAARVRLSPNILDNAASIRPPSNPSGTGRLRCSVMLTRSAFPPVSRLGSSRSITCRSPFHAGAAGAELATPPLPCRTGSPDVRKGPRRRRAGVPGLAAPAPAGATRPRSGYQRPPPVGSGGPGTPGLAAFLALLARHAQGGAGEGAQPLLADRALAGLAHPVGARVHPGD